MPSNAPRAHAALAVEQREAVVSGLRKLPLLRYVSQRLLADMVDCCRVYGAAPTWTVPTVKEAEVSTPLEPTPEMVEAPILAIAVLDGVVQAKQSENRNINLSVGTYGRLDAGLNSVGLGSLQLAPPHKGPSTYLLLTPEVAKTSPQMLHSLIAGADDRKLRALLVKMAQPELILLDADQPFVGILRPMMHILAAAVAKSRPQHPNTGLVEYGEKIPVAKWNSRMGGFAPVQLGRPPTERDLRNLVDHDAPGSVFVLRPRDPAGLARLKEIAFDRIVYLTDRVPRVMPEHLRVHLRSEVFGESERGKSEPYLISFVPTVLVPPRNPPPGYARRRFDVLQIAHSRVDRDSKEGPPGLRPYRDSCVVPMRRGALRRAWEKWLPRWETGAETQFLDTAAAAGALRRESAERWARAVSLRRVGVALSGGGACAYRFVPILERLRRLNVPVDVFAGLSGGALLGVFYCLFGGDGLRRFVNLGTMIQTTLPLTVWTTGAFERITDYLLGGAVVENLEVRLGAVTVALPDNDTPFGAVIVQGTLGAAARASGTLPPAYAPTEKDGIRYTDGGACTAVPAHVARDCGADVVLACNAIPGPNTCNPFPAGVFGNAISRTLRRLPPWDRIIDFESWRSFQWQQVSRHFGHEADAFIEFPPSTISASEPVLFALAHRIIAAALKEREQIEEQISILIEKWNDPVQGAMEQ